MSQPFDIRAANESDLPSLLDLYVHLNGKGQRCSDEEAGAIFQRFQLYPDSQILIATSNSICISSCTLVVIPNLTRGGRPYGLIENVVTHEDYRNRGLGKAILNAATNRAWKAGCYKIMLLTGSSRPETIAFYKSAGFEQTKTGFQIRQPDA